MLTDNPVLVRNLHPTPAILCAQRKAEKRVSTEDDFIRSNIESFGNGIGVTTNRITGMYEIRAGYEKGSKEYETLTYRIRCGQLFQQNEIDKAKGIVCKPMPRTWHDRHTVNKIEDEEERAFYRQLVSDRKPYFMRYIYPDLMKQYNTYTKNADKNALREFDLTVEEVAALPERTERQEDFLKYYAYRMPVGTSDCVMNRICRRIEEEFDGYIGRFSSSASFDYRFLRSDEDYSASQFDAVRKLYEEYGRRLSAYSLFAATERIDGADKTAGLTDLNRWFDRECHEICPNDATLCNILLDVCYRRGRTKRFVWSICGGQIVRNLLHANGGMLSFPVPDEEGDILYCGERYSEHMRHVREEEKE